MKVLLAWSGMTATVTMVSSLFTADPVIPARSTTTPPLRPVVAAKHPVLSRAITPTRAPAKFGARGMAIAALDSTVQRYCGSCHNATMRRGNLSLKGYSIANATQSNATEKIIRKLRAEMMPPPGSKRPTGDTLLALVETLESTMDAVPVNPGTRSFQRLNRAEYERVLRDLLGVQVNAGDWLPLDQKSANFDNISDVQALSPTLLEGYLNAAAAVSRMALGDRKAVVSQTLYKTSPFASQHP